MELQAHPLLTLVECNKNVLKSMLTSYIDATVDNHYNFMKQNIVSMIQSGMLGPNCNSDATQFGMALSINSNDQTQQNHPHNNINLQNDIPLANTINTDDDDDPMIKLEIDNDDDDGQEIDVNNVENCEDGISNSDRENYDNIMHNDTETGGENGNEPLDVQPNVHAPDNQTNESIISNDIQNELVDPDKEQSNPSTSGRSSTARKQIPRKFFDKANNDKKIQNRNTKKQKNRIESNNKSVKKVKSKSNLNVENDDEAESNVDINENQEVEANQNTAPKYECIEPGCSHLSSSRTEWEEHLWSAH